MKNKLQPSAQKTIGSLLRFWRQHNRKSQMDLALDVGISTRHLSFVETGKSQPSRELVLGIGQILQLPFRQQNSLLIAAGYAPQFKEMELSSEALIIVNDAMQQLLNNHNPYPALVVNSRYDILMFNKGYEKFLSSYLDSAVLAKYPNALALFYADDGLKPHVRNWNTVAPLLFSRVLEEAMASQDAYLLDWLESFSFNSDVAVMQPLMDYGLPMLTLEFEKDGQIGRFFTTIATIGTPLDLTTQEIRLEMLYPADEETQYLFKD